MAISWRANGTSSASTTTCAPTLPAGVVSSDILLLFLVWRSTATAPTIANWTLIAETQVTVGAEGADSGTVATAVYQAPGGTAAPSIGVSGRNGAVAWILAYQRSAGTGWLVGSATGVDSTINTSHSAAATTSPGGAVNDVLVSFSGTNGDAIVSTRTTLSADWPTFGLGTLTNRAGTGTTSGNDIRVFADDVPVQSGSDTGNPSVTWTWGTGSTANHPASAVVYVRLREDSGAAPVSAPPESPMRRLTPLLVR